MLPLGCLALVSPPLVIKGAVPFRLGQSSFFFLGLFLSRFSEKVARPRALAAGCLAAVAVICILRDMLLGKHGLPVSGALPYVMLWFVWMVYDFVAPVNCAKASGWSRYVFLIFGVHIVFLNWMLPPLRSAVNTRWLMPIMTPISAVVTISLSIALAIIIEKCSKYLYRVISGGR